MYIWITFLSVLPFIAIHDTYYTYTYIVSLQVQVCVRFLVGIKGGWGEELGQGIPLVAKSQVIAKSGVVRGDGSHHGGLLLADGVVHSGRDGRLQGGDNLGDQGALVQPVVGRRRRGDLAVKVGLGPDGGRLHGGGHLRPDGGGLRPESGGSGVAGDGGGVGAGA